MVHTHVYNFTHAKEPKGRGRWAFSNHRNPEPEQIKFYYGTYTEARKQAVTEFAKMGLNSIYVLP